MAVTVEIIEGPLKGSKFELKPGMKIGRSGADLNLKDPKVSSQHAEIRLLTGSLNTLVLFDLGSTNGIKLNGKKVGSLDLVPGTTFQIGNTVLKIAQLDSKEDTIPEIAEWRAHLLRAVSKVIDTTKTDKNVRPFDPMVVLKIKDGPQKGEQYVLGYGPRTIGRNSSELSLLDPSLAEVSFELIPTAQGNVLFQTKNSEEIRLNGLSKESETITSGDQLQIGQTVIEISFDR